MERTLFNSFHICADVLTKLDERTYLCEIAERLELNALEKRTCNTLRGLDTAISRNTTHATATEVR